MSKPHSGINRGGNWVYGYKPLGSMLYDIRTAAAEGKIPGQIQADKDKVDKVFEAIDKYNKVPPEGVSIEIQGDTVIARGAGLPDNEFRGSGYRQSLSAIGKAHGLTTTSAQMGSAKRAIYGKLGRLWKRK